MITFTNSLLRPPPLLFLVALFADLDTHAHLGVISYGVSMTTLEDVFLKLEAEAEIDQAGKGEKKPA